MCGAGTVGQEGAVGAIVEGENLRSLPRLKAVVSAVG